MSNGKKINKKILIAEDEKLMARALADKFTGLGFYTEVFSDGASALERLNKERFDLIFLDVLMPKLDGLSLLKEIRSKNNNTPVVILSNSSKDETIKEAKRLGAMEYFVKSNTSLIEIVGTAKRILEI